MPFSEVVTRGISLNTRLIEETKLPPVALR